MVDGSVKIAVGYVRCSTDEQGATSIPQQKEELAKFAKMNQYQIVKWFVDEGRSGTTFKKRPAFMELEAEVENSPKFRFVLVYDESRWGRAMNPRESNYWKMHFEMFNVKVRMMHSSSKNEDDIGSYVVEVVESAEASEYSKKLSRSIRRGMLSDQQGKYSRGGTAPYGYKRIAIDLQTGERKELRDGLRSVPHQEKVIWELGNPMEVQTVKRIFEMKTEGIGYVGIADRLNTEKISCPKRGRWKNKEQKWSGSTIEGIITNPVYTGDRIYNRLTFSKFVAKEKHIDIYATGDRVKLENDQSEWRIALGAHEAIITKELFEEANRFRERRARRPNQHLYRSTYLLTGLIRCSKCNFNYQGHHHKPSGHKYYVDGGAVNKGKSVCNWFSIRQNVLEEFVIKSVKDNFLGSGIRKRIKKYLTEMFDNQPTAIRQKVETLDAQIIDSQLKIKNLVALAEKGINLDSIAERINELEEQLKTLRSERSKIAGDDPLKTVDRKIIIQAVTNFLENFEQKFESVPILEKKELLRKVVEKIVVNPDERKVSCYIKRLPMIETVENPSDRGGVLLGAASSANGNRTRITALRGQRPKPLDDSAKFSG